MSTKALGLSIVIGSIFSGASAIGSAVRGIDSVKNRISSLKQEKVTLKEKFGEASVEVKKLDNDIDKLNNNLQKLYKNQNAISKIKENRTKFKSSILDNVALGATAFAPLKVAIDFESAMADVGKVVDFGVGEAEVFGKEIRELSKTIPLAATELASITASGGQLGIAKEELLDFTTVTAKMSTAFDMLPAQAGDTIANLMNIYGMGIKDVTKLGDAINHISNNSAAKAKYIVDVLGRTGGISKMIGLSAKETSSLASAFLAMGTAPDVASTAINALLSKLGTVESQGKKFDGALAKIGLSSRELKNNLKDNAEGAILDFLEKIKDVDDDEKLTLLSDMFGAEYSDDIALLVGGLDNYKKSIKNVADESKYLGSMQNEFEVRSKTTANNMKLLSQNITNIGITIGNLLLPPLNILVTVFSNIASKIGDFIAEFPTLSLVVGGAIIGFIGLKIAISSAMFISGLFGTTFLQLKSAFIIVSSFLPVLQGAFVTTFTAIKVAIASTTFSFSMMALAIVAIPAIIAGLFFVIKNNWEMLSSFFSELWTGIKTIFFIGWDFIKSIFSYSPLGLIIKAWSPVFEWIGSKMDFFSDFFNFFAGENSVSSEVNSNINTKIESPSDAIAKANSTTNTKSTNQVNHIQIAVNNPTSNVDVEKAIKDGMYQQSRQESLWDGEY